MIETEFIIFAAASGADSAPERLRAEARAPAVAAAAAEDLRNWRRFIGCDGDES